VDGRCVLSPLRIALDEYLALRRALGYKLYWQGLQLQQFVKFAEQAGAAYISPDLALKWATQPADAPKTWWSIRLGVVRRFAQFCSSRDPLTCVPPPGLLPSTYRRVPPYLYRDQDLKALL
jgi:integrase/recombinase XerD